MFFFLPRALIEPKQQRHGLIFFTPDVCFKDIFWEGILEEPSVTVVISELFCLQKKEDGEDRQKVKLSKMSNEKNLEEEERREMITPALRDALTKQGGSTSVYFFCSVWVYALCTVC